MAESVYRVTELVGTSTESWEAAVRNAVETVEEHLLLGALFAALVVFLFLRNGRSTLIAGLAIPTSIVAMSSMSAWFTTLRRYRVTTRL